MLRFTVALTALVAPFQEDDAPDWVFQSSSTETLVDPDSLVQFDQSPIFRKGELELRASWLVVWLDRREMERLSELPFGGELPPEDIRRQLDERRPRVEEREAPIPNIFQRLASSQFSSFAREMYLEGPVEFFLRGERMLLADAVYLDLVDGHGWIANVTAIVKRKIGGRVQKIQVRADWMRHSADGSLRANSATMTTGDFEDSSLSISSGDLSIRPTDPDDLGEWEFKLRRNRIHLVGGIWLPLPAVAFNTEAGGKPILETFGFGDSARLGSFVQATFNREMGGAGRSLNRLLSGDPKKYDAHYSLRASYLGSRGVLGDVGVDLESEERYWLRFHVAGVDDSDEDRGLVRVDPAERSGFRNWFRAQGRYLLGEREWIDLRLSTQSDPAVQSEFFEDDYLRYEQRATDVHWRRADAQTYWAATARWRLDDFRTEIEEQPEVQFSLGATDVATIFGRPLLYRAEGTAGYLRRREGDPRFDFPFTDPDGNPDGLGDREVLRIHSRQRLSLPFSTGAAGVRAIPFLDATAAGWDRSATDDEAVGRASLAAGLRLATTFWKTTDAGGTVQLSPFAEVRTDLAETESTAEPVRFDALEDRAPDEVAEVGLRGLWKDESGQRWFDAQVRTAFADAGVGGADEAWEPVEILLGLKTPIGGVPVGVFHDAFYSLEGGGTLYSLTDVGAKLSPDLALELSHRRARELAGTPVFETAAVTGRYRWTEKWEFEARREISLVDDTRLEDSFVVRRYGYDLVLDLELEDRAGEGTSVSFRVEPLILWDGSRIGVVRALE